MYILSLVLFLLSPLMLIASAVLNIEWLGLTSIVCLVMGIFGIFTLGPKTVI